MSWISFDDFVGWAAYQTIFFVACNSDSYILAALQTVGTVLCTQRHRLDADRFPMFSVSWAWQAFCGDLNLCWSEKRAVTLMRPVDLRTSRES